MALTKVDLDYLINKDPNEVNVKPEKWEQASRSYSHNRILSGISKSNIQNPTFKGSLTKQREGQFSTKKSSKEINLVM